MGVSNLVPDAVSDSCLSYTIMAQLKKKKNEAKLEFERMVGLVGQKIPLSADGIKVAEKSNPPSKFYVDILLDKELGVYDNSRSLFPFKAVVIRDKNTKNCS